jgi:hypothetical protein
VVDNPEIGAGITVFRCCRHLLASSCPSFRRFCLTSSHLKICVGCVGVVTHLCPSRGSCCSSCGRK